MPIHKIFEVDITCDVDPASLVWPEASDVGYLAGNRLFRDLHGATWQQAEETYSTEMALIAQLEAAASEGECDTIASKLREEPGSLYGLDAGIASTAIAVSAARCIPISSCNAGSFGGLHYEDFPLVALYVRPQAFVSLLRCAVDSGAGFSNGNEGEAILYASGVTTMMKLARLIIDRRIDFSR